MLKLVFAVPGLLLVALLAQQPAAPPAPAAAPAEAAPMVNPVKPTAASQEHAKKMYGYDCAMCHGANGNGKGDLVADMKLTLKDMSDGEIFTVIKNGKGQMSGEGDRLKPDDIWNMVVLVRSFAKK